APLVTHHEERRPVDAEPGAEHHAGAARVVLERPDDLVDPVEEAARPEMLGRLGALPAIRAVLELLLHHGDVHGRDLSPRAPRGQGAGCHGRASRIYGESARGAAGERRWRTPWSIARAGPSSGALPIRWERPRDPAGSTSRSTRSTPTRCSC